MQIRIKLPTRYNKRNKCKSKGWKSTKIGWFTANFILVIMTIIHDIIQSIKEEKNTDKTNIADRPVANFHHSRPPTFIQNCPFVPLIIHFQKFPCPLLIPAPTCFTGTLEYTKIIFATLQSQWHGFIRHFYSQQKFMILSIKERYLVSMESFLCYSSLLNFLTSIFWQHPN